LFESIEYEYEQFEFKKSNFDFVFVPFLVTISKCHRNFIGELSAA